MDIVGLIGAVLGSGVISALATWRLSNKKADQDGFKILFDKLEEDNKRLREEEEDNRNLIAKLERQVNELVIKVQLMESAHNDIPIPQWFVDTHGRMLSGNEAYTERFGIDIDVLNKTQWEIWPEDSARDLVNAASKAVRSESIVEIEQEVLLPDGKEKWEIIIYPRYASGIIIGVSGIAWKSK